MKYLFAILALSMVFTSCKKSAGSNSSPNYWDVKYEVTCTNPKTQVSLIFKDSTGNVQTIGEVSNPSTTYQKVPWIYEAHYSKDPGLIMARGLSLDVFDAYNFNSATDKVTAQIYVNGSIVNQNTIGGVLGILITYILN